MEKLMSHTDFVILGMLSLEPMSGYGIKQEIKHSIGAFWQESDGQIYPALKRLMDLDHISLLEASEPSGRNKKTYQITQSGQSHLNNWLTQPVGKNTVRNEFCLKLFFAGNSNVATTIDMIQAERRALIQSRQAIQQAQKDINALDAKQFKDHIPYWHATTNYGEAIVDAKIKWCNEVLASLSTSKENTHH
jgi:PadR family transcriptional regulator, regulatory protein AphA